ADSFLELDEAAWNALDRADFVFADLRFFKALEMSGSIGRRTGWFPRILMTFEEGRLTGALPLFVKSNSYGEYIFDWAWAQAAEGAGIDYYPKLVAAIPFTPATGPKLLLSENPIEAAKAREFLMTAALELSKDVSSLHFLFTPAVAASGTPVTEVEDLRERSFLIRHSFQYHWRNRGWSTFEDFLGAFRSKRRTEIRREREAVAKSPVKIERLTGDQLTAEHAEIMYQFYRSTTEKMGGQSYLTRKFFEAVFETMKDSILFVLASNADGVAIAGALNFYKGKTLFGRYWGCLEEYKNLHFEVCYYQAIDWALARGFQLFEAGAQGEHKFNRGFTPHLTYSAHVIHNADLSDAISDFLEREKVSIDHLFEDYKEHDPFKR
ncbi:MAG: GNAT family N-acetyltransferase, partial [Proteobacteria bacterium]